MLFLGRIHPKKGISLLLEAWSSVVGIRERGWRLIIAGWDDGGHAEALKSLVVQLGLGETVIFKGPVFGEQKERLFRSAAAFILPSFSEGLPMAVLEAWSYGLPVLMTDACHLPEGFAANAAIRIDPTPESIATGLSRLISVMSDTEREAMGARGRVLVEERFSWDRISTEMCKIYDQATARSTGPGQPPLAVSDVNSSEVLVRLVREKNSLHAVQAAVTEFTRIVALIATNQPKFQFEIARS